MENKSNKDLITRPQGEDISPEEKSFNQEFLQRLSILNAKRKTFIKSSAANNNMVAIIAAHPALSEFAITYNKIACLNLGQELYEMYQQDSGTVLLTCIKAKLKPVPLGVPPKPENTRGAARIWCDGCNDWSGRDWGHHEQENHHKHPGLVLVCFQLGCPRPIQLRAETAAFDEYLARHGIYVNLLGTGGILMTTTQSDKIGRLGCESILVNIEVQGGQLGGGGYKARKAVILGRLDNLGEDLADNLEPFASLPALDGMGRFTQAEIAGQPTKAALVQRLQSIRRALFPRGDMSGEDTFERAETVLECLEQLEEDGELSGMTVEEVQKAQETAGM